MLVRMHLWMRLALGVLLSRSIGLCQVITTEVGTDPPGIGQSQAATATPLGQIYAVAFDPSGNLYIADYEGNQVFRVAPSGTLTLVAGNGFAGFSGDGGPAVNASIKSPQGVAVGSDGTIYISDTGNDRLRRVATDGTISTYAGNGFETFSGDGGLATNASLFAPNGLAFDAAGNLYVADTRHSRIRRISLGGIITTVAGNGQETYAGEGIATASALNDPVAIAFDGSGSLYIADTLNNRIRRVTNGTISTFAGVGQPGYLDGPASSAVFSFPKGMAFDSNGNLFIADPGNNLIRKIESNVVSTVAGNGALAFAGDGGNPLAASLAGPSAVAVDPSGDLFIADTMNDRIRLLSASTNNISTFAGNGAFRLSADGIPALSSFLSEPEDVKLGPDGLLYIVDAQNNRILRMNADNTVVTVAGNGQYGFSGDGHAANSASLYFPRHISFDSNGNMYIADTLNLRIRRVTPQGIISTIAGNGQPGYSGDNGPALNASLKYPTDAACDSAGNLYIADQLNNVIRVVKNGTISTFAGNGKAAYGGDGIPAVNSSLNEPYGLFIDSMDVVYIADTYNHRIRNVTKDGVIHLVAGTGVVHYGGDGGLAVNAQLNSPSGVAADGAGDLFISDSGNDVIRIIHPNQIIGTVAGNGSPGYTGDGAAATAATLNEPLSMTPDGLGGLHIADALNNRIRRLLPTSPSYDAAPSTFTFNASAGGSVTPPQTIQVSSTVTGLGFTVALSDSWLTASLTSGSMPSSVEITVDPSQLAAGTHKGTVTITSALASVPNRVVTVSVNVAPAEAPQLTVDSSGINFTFVQGATPGKATLTVSNKGGGVITFAVSSSTTRGGQWLTISPSAGTVTPSAPVSLNIAAASGTLDVGAYTGAITVTTGTAGQIKVPVTMAISASVSKILLSQTGLSFVGVSKGGSVLPQSIGILNVGGGVMNWSAQASTLTGSGWLALSSTSGTVNRPFLDVSFTDVLVNARSLAPGTYYGSIQVSATNADNAPQTVLIVLNVLPTGSNPGPEVNPTGLIFTGVAGAEDPGSQDVSIANVTGNPVLYGSSATYVTGGNWLAYSPQSATVTPDTPVNIVVQPHITNLQPGIRRGALTLALDDGSIRTVSVLSVLAPAGSMGANFRGQEAAGIKSTSGCQPTKLSPVFTQIGAGLTVPAGWPVAVIAQVVDDCGSPMTQGSAVVSFSNGDPPLPLISLQNGQWSGTWQPGNASGPSVTASLSAQSESSLAGAAQTIVGLQGNKVLPSASGGVANAVDLTAGPLAPGELVWIKGTGLADGQASSSASPLPLQLAGASVVIGGRLASLLYADESQVLGVVPPDLPANSSQQIILLHGTSTGIPSPAIVAATQPAVFTQDGSGTGQALAYKAGILADAGHPVQPGDQVVIYCAGLGAVDAQGAVMNPVAVTIGGLTAHVNFAGLAVSSNYPAEGPPAILGVSTGLGGLYQITATVPSNVAGGAAAIVLSSTGQTSPPSVSLAVGSGPLLIPAVTAVVNGASFLGGGVVPGEIATLFGTNLTASIGANITSSLPLPKTFLNDAVIINGLPVPLFAVDNVNGQEQFNFQVPWEVVNGPNADIAVMNNGTTGASVSVRVLAAQPGIFNYNVGGTTFGAILHSNFQLADAAHPATKGETVLIYCTGLGVVSSPPDDGTAANGQATVATTTVTIGGVSAAVSFSGLAPGFVGLYQVNAAVPSGIASGNQPVVIREDGSSSNSVMLPVQ
jgi:uncharacterized protein (TIGR03437 family)